MLTDDERRALQDLLTQALHFRTGIKLFRDRSHNRRLTDSLATLHATLESAFAAFSLQAHLLTEDTNEPI